MPEPLQVIENILHASGLDRSLNDTELKEVTFLLGLDLNQFLLEKLFSALSPQELKEIEGLIANKDSDAALAALIKVGEQKSVNAMIDAALEEYQKAIGGDFKKINSIVEGKKAEGRLRGLR